MPGHHGNTVPFIGSRAGLSVLVIGVLLSSALAGCAWTSDASKIVISGPRDVRGQYGVKWNGSLERILDFEVVGSGQGMLSTGEFVEMPTLIAKSTEPPTSPLAGLRYEFLFHMADPNRLGSLTMKCYPTDETSCHLAADEGPASRHAPVFHGWPSFFGAGPFLNESLSTGWTKTITYRGPVATFGVTWNVQAVSTEPPYGKCVDLQGRPDGLPAYSFSLAPPWGRLTLCEGIPVPIHVEFGRLELSIQTLEDRGAWPVGFAPRDDVASQAPSPDCWPREPAEDRQTLPVGDWLDWARSNDEYIVRWYEDHPNSLSSLGYGWRTDTSTAQSLGYSWNVQAYVFLQDSESGDLIVRLAEMTQSTNLLGETTIEYEPSSAVYRRDAPVAAALHRPECGTDQESLKSVADGLLSRYAPPPYLADAHIAPFVSNILTKAQFTPIWIHDTTTMLPSQEPVLSIIHAPDTGDALIQQMYMKSDAAGRHLHFVDTVPR